MSRIRRLFAAFAALVFALGVAIPAGAATAKGTINIADAGDSTYSIYKVFSASVGEGGAISYTIKSDDQWFSVVYDSTNNASKVKGLEFTPGTGGSASTYTVTWTDGFDAASFASDLKKESSGKSTAKDSVTAAEGSTTATFSELDGGYYLVLGNGTNDTLGMLTTVLELDPGETVTIQNKNDMPFDKVISEKNETEIDKKDKQKESDVQVGDTLTFKITGVVPTTTDYKSYTYLVSDAMDEGLKFNQPVTVKIDGSDVILQEITNASTQLSGDQVRYNENGFELSLDMLSRGKSGDESKAGKAVVITYTATVTKDAVCKVSENEAKLHYSNDPNDETSFANKDTETKTYSSKVVINKYETGAEEQKLAGAKFKLYKDGDNGSKLYYKVGTDGTVMFEAETDDSKGTEVTTDSDGAASFSGLPDGQYHLEETEAPNGYSKLTEAINVTIDGSSSTTVDLTASQVANALTKTVNVANTPGSLIPSTGGMGTTIFYVASAAVLAVIIVRVVRHRREA